MGVILKSFPSKRCISKVRTVPRSPFFLIGVWLLTACGSGGPGDFSCQGLGANTVSGTVRYEKKHYNENGFTGQKEFLPVRFVPIEVWNGQDLLASTTTDDQGHYCAIYVNSRGRTLNSVIVTASSLTTSKIQVGSFFQDPTDDLFHFLPWWVSGFFDERQGGTSFSVNFDLRDDIADPTLNPGGVFNILDTLGKGREVFKRMTGKEPPLLTVIWDRSLGGTFFTTMGECRQIVAGGAQGIFSDCIFIRGDGDVIFDEVSGDRDEYDDDVMLHEFGHFIAHSFSKDDSPGGTHFLGDHSQDVRLAWSEGWATFFSSAVRNNPVNVDVGIDGEPLFAFTVESDKLLYPNITPEPLNRDGIYTTSEVAIISVLWDIFDGPNENFDTLSLGFSSIWDVLTFWRSAPPVPPITIESFWDSFGSAHPSFLNITGDRRMEFAKDLFEDDNAPRPTRKLLGLGELEHHTLFPEGDIDYIAFDAVMGQQYIVETLNLTNGADTFLEILDVDGQTVLARNDDMNQQNPDSKPYIDGCNTWAPVCVQFDSNGICLDTRLQARSSPSCPNGPPGFPVKDEDTHDNPFPSQIIFTAPATGIFYAKVYRSPNAPPSTGRYGSYNFHVTTL